MSTRRAPAQPSADAHLEELRAIREELRQLRQVMAIGEKVFLSAFAAAKLLGIDRGRVSRLCKAGILRARRNGRGWEIPRTELERLQQEGIPAEPGKVGRPRKKLPASSGAEIRKLEI